MSSAHINTFARDRLPPAELQPVYRFDLLALQFPPQLNCATELPDRRVEAGEGDRLRIQAPGIRRTYADLQEHANRIANVLVNEMGVVSDNRVLLRSSNSPMLTACWFVVMKVGAIAVTTMPLLRAKELGQILGKGEIGFALCDARLVDELRDAVAQAAKPVQTLCFHDDTPEGLEAAMACQPAVFANVDTVADDTYLLAFTSDTTGVPKATMYFHRDILAICAYWLPHALQSRANGIPIGSPPMAFTFGLGSLLLFPMSVGASTVLLEKASSNDLVDDIRTFGAMVLFTAPTTYRNIAARGNELRATPLRHCVSAGEALPVATRMLWKNATGIELIDGTGVTEMLHIFIPAADTNMRPGATGKAVLGYVVQVVDDAGNPMPPGTVGRLAIQGPTGCRYLSDDHQRVYVHNGWNLTGDAHVMDEEGYFHYHSCTDDMIISSGYNIAAPEVEDALMQHPAVAERGVIGEPDEERGQIVKALVVLHPGHSAGPEMVKTLQDFVKQTVAPYKCPRTIEFRASLPCSEVDKLLRYRLREHNKS